MSENITYVNICNYYTTALLYNYYILLLYNIHPKTMQEKLGKITCQLHLIITALKKYVYKCTIIMIVCVPIKFNMHFSNTPCTHSILGLQN